MGIRYPKLVDTDGGERNLHEVCIVIDANHLSDPVNENVQFVTARFTRPGSSLD